MYLCGSIFGRFRLYNALIIHFRHDGFWYGRDFVGCIPVWYFGKNHDVSGRKSRGEARHSGKAKGGAEHLPFAGPLA